MILITFSQDVKVHGDGSQEPSHVAGDRLNDLDALLRSGQTLAHEMSIQPLNESGRLVMGGFALSLFVCFVWLSVILYVCLLC